MWLHRQHRLVMTASTPNSPWQHICETSILPEQRRHRLAENVREHTGDEE